MLIRLGRLGKGTIAYERPGTKGTVGYFESNLDQRDTRAIANPDLSDHFNDPYRASSQTKPYFWEPVNIHVDDQDRLHVAESRRHRLRVFQRALQAAGSSRRWRRETWDVPTGHADR